MLLSQVLLVPVCVHRLLQDHAMSATSVVNLTSLMSVIAMPVLLFIAKINCLKLTKHFAIKLMLL